MHRHAAPGNRRLRLGHLKADAAEAGINEVVAPRHYCTVPAYLAANPLWGAGLVYDAHAVGFAIKGHNLCILPGGPFFGNDL